MKKKSHPYLQKLVDYSTDVISGKIVACQKNIWSCERFLNDLKRSENNDPTFPYEFIPEQVELFEDWCAMFKHTKGPLTGQFIYLAPVISFVAGNIYGWYNKKDGSRRFKKSYWQVARKNAKTQLHALIGSYELLVFSRDEQAEVYAAATKAKQAKITLKETMTMLRRCEDLEEGTQFAIRYGEIERIRTGGIMAALTQDDKKDGDGLNPSCGLIDEYHMHKTSEMLDIITSGQTARENPLASIITTAGFEFSYPCYRVEYPLISKILDPNNPINIETYFVMVCELEMNTSSDTIEVDGRSIAPGELIDDINDESVWVKANPVQCSYPKGISNTRDDLDLAKASPEKMKNFLTKNMNVWVNQREFGYMDMAKWSSCGVSSDELIEQIKEYCDGTVYIGGDLSKRIDLTSLAFEFVGNNDKFYVIHHSFIPEAMFHEKIAVDGVPYDLWEKQGYLTVTQGNVVDYRAVKDWALDFAKKNGWAINEVCLDPHGAVQLSGDLIDDGIEVVDIRQGALTLSEPTKDIRYMVYSGRFVHGNDPVLTWAMGNAVTKVYHNESILLDKEKSTGRIDPAAALMNSHTRAMYVEAKPQNRVMFI